MAEGENLLSSLTASFSQSFAKLFGGGADEAPPPDNPALLRQAVKTGDTYRVAGLLKEGGLDVDAPNSHGDTALILAAWYGKEEIVDLLLEAGADLEAVNTDGNCALNCAAFQGHTDVATLLLNRGATVDVGDAVTGKTALVKAAYVGHARMVQLLLSRGANVDVADAQGYTALAFAASFNHVEAIRVLLGAHADSNAADAFGISPLIHAAARGYADAARLLLEAGAALDHRDAEGVSARDYAESAGFDDVLEVLERAEEEQRAAASTSPSRIRKSYAGYEAAAIGAPAPADAAPAEPDLTPRSLPQPAGRGGLIWEGGGGGAGGGGKYEERMARARAGNQGAGGGGGGGSAAGGEASWEENLVSMRMMTPRGGSVGDVGGDAGAMIRLTPRVPTAGDVQVAAINGGLTARGNGTARGGGGTARGIERLKLGGADTAGGGGAGGGPPVRPEQLATLDQATLRKLLRKLVRLTIDLEDSTAVAADDAQYPSFAEAWQVNRPSNAF